MAVVPRYCNGMNNLTPQLRADRNGKLVTRHVKNDVTQPKTRSFAPPVIKRQESELSQKQVKAERPLKKSKKRKVPSTGIDIATLRFANKSIPEDSVQASDEDIYAFLKTGTTMQEAIALKAAGMEFYSWPDIPEQGENEQEGVYVNRKYRFMEERKRILSRQERYSEVAHRLELKDIPADAASKALANGLSMKALTGYLTEEQAVALYSKTSYTKNNMHAMDELVNGNIPFGHFESFGIKNLNAWEKNCPVYREMSPELIKTVTLLAEAAAPHPNGRGANASEATLIKIAHKDERVVQLGIPSLMWHEERLKREGGVFTFEEATVVDDFIDEVRSRGITDLSDNKTYVGSALRGHYPDREGDYDSQYECAKILDWHNAGLSNEQIITGMQNRWSKEQAVSVYLEDAPSSLAGGIL